MSGQAETNPNKLYLYAIIRADLEMLAGKLSAQSGHAYTDCLFNALDTTPDLANQYRRDGFGGSKVTLKAKNLASLMRAKAEAEALGFTTALITDRDHVLLPHFDGSPVITALGIGPVLKSQARAVTKRLQCL